MSRGDLPTASGPPFAPGMSGRFLLPAAALALWTLVGWLLLSPLPRFVHIAQDFGVRLPWLSGLAGGVPSWLVVVTALAACVAGFRAGGRRGRFLWLLVVPAAAALIAILCTFGALAGLRGAMVG